mgnify:CR=1 FL=1
MYEVAENCIAQFHQAEAALIFNSGYDANVGFFSCVPQRNDIILYDELCHASIRDGIQMSHAKAYKFQHNDTEDLSRLLQKLQTPNAKRQTVYIVTESVFSMDGDSPHIEALTQLAQKYNAYLVIDEAHALGGLERIADVPIYSTDAIVRRAPALQATADARAPRAGLPSALWQLLRLAESLTYEKDAATATGARGTTPPIAFRAAPHPHRGAVRPGAAARDRSGRPCVPSGAPARAAAARLRASVFRRLA